MNIVKGQGAKIAATCALGALSFLSFAGTPAKAQDVVVVRHHRYWHREPGVVVTTPGWRYHRRPMPVVIEPPLWTYHPNERVVVYNNYRWRRFHRHWVRVY